MYCKSESNTYWLYSSSIASLRQMRAEGGRMETTKMAESWAGCRLFMAPLGAAAATVRWALDGFLVWTNRLSSAEPLLETVMLFSLCGCK